MNIKIKYFRNLLVILFMSITLLILSPSKSSAHFDKLAREKIYTLTIGEWAYYGQPNDIVEIIKEEQGWVDDNDYYNDYLFDLIFIPKDPNNPEHEDLDPIYKDYVEVKEFYQNYTIPEIVEIVDLLKDFTDAFLTDKDEDGNPIYPDGLSVTPVELELGEGLLPGQSKQINQVFHTANSTGQHPNAWIPLMISLSIEAPEGYDEFDISDFAIELLIDGNPFAESNPMTYRYVLWDKYSGSSKNRLQSNQIKINSFNYAITDTIYYNNEIRRKVGSTYTPVIYRHKLTKPTLYGNWNRFPIGPNYYLGAPTGGNNHQTYHPFSPDSRSGMILNGTADGKQTEIRLEIPQRNPQDTYAIPIVVNISRGLELDENLNPLELQKQDSVLPVVKIKIVSGSFLWAE